MEQVAFSGGQSGSECVEYSNKRPAIGKTDTGKKKDFPTCWIVAKNFPDSLDLFIFHFPPNKTDTLSLK